ncbi:MAG: tRNA (guanosine(37)-N1)-methyltransferase TrmD [Actinobacteria bacterium]|jgi:tRNA (guanine37-N1)-methyltransferase|uniref:tRNA (guanine-N(1)-)-methyltransferase n=1 Tax=freshwater metagenome TaxID=449393 RepID=A0A6J7JN47_9ZZZZ|nr:tRNA (guanosine(37)-N1)-methyltransferase TrmD [Actinomycetota bacterium]MSX27323.1 tRNA (guanosine(37)-N1)-methyltransferase TrmD [Actinomycetota bacterium]MSY11274.1 tRNA (guanosine(37)-N1)-methyltransferase TrmD [Actinomycetota bacterium]
MLRFDLISIFPEYLSPLKLSLLGKAQDKGLLAINIHDLRDQTTDVHHSVDDTPYGGGAGMVMSPVAWGDAIDQISSDADQIDLVILTPAGKKFNQKMAYEFSKSKQIIFACGRYEGIDARVGKYYMQQKNYKVHEVSIGDYVLGGGEVAAMVIIEAVARLLPGVLGNPDSLKEESHSIAGNKDESLVEYPNYTKPASWRGLDVPEILLSGNHGEIAKWRRSEAERRTRELEAE